MDVVLNTVAPVFAIIALGYFLAARRRLHVPSLSDLAILVTSPALMFTVLSDTHLEAERWASLAGGTIFVAGGPALLAVAYLKLAAPGHRGVLLPAIFWNAGKPIITTGNRKNGKSEVSPRF